MTHQTEIKFDEANIRKCLHKLEFQTYSIYSYNWIYTQETIGISYTVKDCYIRSIFKIPLNPFNALNTTKTCRR